MPRAQRQPAAVVRAVATTMAAARRPMSAARPESTMAVASPDDVSFEASPDCASSSSSAMLTRTVAPRAAASRSMDPPSRSSDALHSASVFVLGRTCVSEFLLFPEGRSKKHVQNSVVDLAQPSSVLSFHSMISYIHRSTEPCFALAPVLYVSSMACSRLEPSAAMKSTFRCFPVVLIWAFVHEAACSARSALHASGGASCKQRKRLIFVLKICSSVGEGIAVVAGCVVGCAVG
mmetsp:Transcript_99788/g.288133  ORF Transcript_99788/g.288133 Transcript_99788/m.288133 type:complete len:234 (-) Transcript_99788:449-1150(-)